MLITQNWPLKRDFFVEPSGVFLLSALPLLGIAIGEKLQFMKKFNFQHQIITSRENKIGTYYVLAAFHRAAIKNA